MTEETNVVELRRLGRQARVASRPALVVAERVIEIGSEADAYTVRRSVCARSGRGFITIRDAGGRIIFLSRDVPEECVSSLIIAYRCGLGAGRAQVMESLS
ncbi:hypothetical protein [Bradyrhizobium sp.]|uniref:hypothetical protein n=1 Tax=Bradyrhizobium sp. TaxID=376 RepID=UPI0007C8E5E7|nr:hypothetical protein [Bradyrhizobium sp.]